MKKSIFLCTIFICLLGFSGPSGALEIDYTDIILGESMIDLDGATLYSSPRDFDVKSVNGYMGFGVDGGYVDGEIDLKNEMVTISFDLPTIIEQLTLGFLFQDGQFGDKVSEVARIEFSPGPDPNWNAYDLSVTGQNTATWSGPGTVNNISGGIQTEAGVWQILNPFGDYLVSELKFTALQVDNAITGTTPSGSRNSDFSIVSVSGNPVPEPGTIILLGSGLLGLVAYGRKRKFFKK